MRPLTPPATRRDPAPSRVAYRMNRLWLTPLFRATLRVGLPAFLIVLTLGLYFANPDRRLAISNWAGQVRASIEERPEFMVTAMKIEGASAEVSNALRAGRLPIVVGGDHSLSIGSARSPGSVATTRAAWATAPRSSRRCPPPAPTTSGSRPGQPA